MLTDLTQKKKKKQMDLIACEQNLCFFNVQVPKLICLKTKICFRVENVSTPTRV